MPIGLALLRMMPTSTPRHKYPCYQSQEARISTMSGAGKRRREPARPRCVGRLSVSVEFEYTAEARGSNGRVLRELRVLAPVPARRGRPAQGLPRDAQPDSARGGARRDLFIWWRASGVVTQSTGRLADHPRGDLLIARQSLSPVASHGEPSACGAVAVPA